MLATRIEGFKRPVPGMTGQRAAVLSSAATMVRARQRLPAIGAILLAAGLALAPTGARAQTILGPRAAGMGDAARAVGTSNDTLFVNPAGMSLFPRYELSAFWRRDTGADGNLWSLSVVDSKSGRVAGGMAYTYEYYGHGGKTRVGSRLDIASSYPLASFLLFGVTVRYLNVATADGPLNRVTGDTGFLVVPTSWLYIGITAHNVISPANQGQTAPRTFGGGVGLALFQRSLTLAFDYQQSTELPGNPSSYNLGLEYFFGGAFIVRAGYVFDGFAHNRRWSAGLGYVNPQFGLDFAYGHTAGYHHVSQVWSLGLRLFF